MEKKRHPKCPKCGSEKVREILYGKFDISALGPNWKKRYNLAGCVVDKDSPKWHCSKCGLDFGRAVN